MATALVRLNQPVAQAGDARSYFFNGRLLTAEDLTREQALREGGDRRLARLIGCGVVQGLLVEELAATQLRIAAGLGVTPGGDVIETAGLDLDLSSAATAGSGGGFANCAAGLADGRPDAGIHLLTLSPAWIAQGRAATLLGEVGACNRRTEQPALRARLVPVLEPAGLDTAHPRNGLAVALLSPGRGLAAVPPETRVGWWLRQRSDASSACAPGLRADELPIALLQISARADITWLDTQAARRALSPPPGSAADQLWPASWATEMQAFAAQFLAEIAAAPSAAGIRWLPPAALPTPAQLTAWLRLLPTSILGRPVPLSRTAFAHRLGLAWQGEPVALASARLYRFTLDGHPERVLVTGDQGGDVAEVIVREGNGEITSPKVASAAGRLLREGKRKPGSEGGPSSDELSVAASALTQAAHRKRR